MVFLLKGISVQYSVVSLCQLGLKSSMAIVISFVVLPPVVLAVGMGMQVSWLEMFVSFLGVHIKFENWNLLKWNTKGIHGICNGTYR